ncbi:MAG TPA: lipid-A-disaccharide synthase [Burkholderiales bacterium]|nr:lipid-A-disaccharide synthase [Burkholderiales bacterium]
MAEPVRIALVAGEASGDLLGSRLIEALRRRLPEAEFCGVGGPRMVAAGFDSWFPQEKLAVRGFVEVVRHLRELLAIRGEIFRRVRALRAQLFVGIDSPEFNLGLERKLKRAGLRTAHLVSPQVWAWRRGRIRRMKSYVSHLLVLFPFEEPLYRKSGVDVTYVGHPLADEIPTYADREGVREQLRLPAHVPVVAILPGSRQSELEMMSGPFIETAKLLHARLPAARFVVPLVTRETRELFETELYRRDARELPMALLFGHARDALAACDVALATSGTVTLEGALTGRAMVIAYRVAPVSYLIAKRLIRVPHVGLPNILCGEAVVPEFMQHDATPENLAQAVGNMLADAPFRWAIEERFLRLHAELRRDSAERAADALLPLVRDATG